MCATLNGNDTSNTGALVGNDRRCAVRRAITARCAVRSPTTRALVRFHAESVTHKLRRAGAPRDDYYFGLRDDMCFAVIACVTMLAPSSFFAPSCHLEPS